MYDRNVKTKQTKQTTHAEILEDLRKAVLEGDKEHPIYVRIAMALSAQIATGNLKPKEALPSHRILARALDVNLSTISKSFKYLKERGLVSSQAGRGTAVRGRHLDHMAPTYERLSTAPRIDLSVVTRYGATVDNLIAAAMTDISKEKESWLALTKYHPAAGNQTSREAGARWFSHTGVTVDADELVITSGAQHGLFLALSATMKQGDIVLVPSLAYQGVKMAAQTLGLGLIPIEIDRHGILPDEIEKHAKNPRVKALFVAPSLDNPTSITLSLQRRHEIARIASEHSLIVIEDEVYRPLCTEVLPSIWELYPDGTFHISSMSKAIAPGIRCGYMAFPRSFSFSIIRSIRSSMWMANPLTIRLATRLIDMGYYVAIIEELRKQLLSRHEDAIKELSPWLLEGEPEGNCLWLNLPSTVPSDEFTDLLHNEGIGVAPASIFTTGDSKQNGIRLYKTSVPDRKQWMEAITTISCLIERPLHTVGRI